MDSFIFETGGLNLYVNAEILLHNLLPKLHSLYSHAHMLGLSDQSTTEASHFPNNACWNVQLISILKSISILKTEFTESHNTSICWNNFEYSFSYRQAVMCGMLAGGFGQFLASPTDLVKVNIQMDGKRMAEGLQPRYRGPSHAFRVIYQQRGFRGLWRGWAPNVQRAALVNMGDLTTYDSVKKYLLRNTSLEDDWLCHFCSSYCSGIVAASLSSPADLVKARVMNQPFDERGRPLVYKSSVDCLLKTVRNEGFFGLYKGFLPCYIRMGPWSMIFWMSYEEIRKVFGVTSF